MITLTSLDRQQKTVVWSATTAIIFSTVFVLIVYFFIPFSLLLFGSAIARSIQSSSTTYCFIPPSYSDSGSCPGIQKDS